MKSIAAFFIVLLVIAATACDDKINPALEPADPIYVVDAFINTGQDDQVIHLTKSQSYFDDTFPPGVSGATVTVSSSDGLETFLFKENPSVPGDYIWSPASGGAWITGVTYVLSVAVNGEQFLANSKLGRV